MTYKGNDNCVTSQVFSDITGRTYCDVSLPLTLPELSQMELSQVGAAGLQKRTPCTLRLLCQDDRPLNIYHQWSILPPPQPPHLPSLFLGSVLLQITPNMWRGKGFLNTLLRNALGYS